MRLILRPLCFQNKNNMPVDWKARPARGRFVLGCVALVVIGALSSYLGYQDGERLTAAWSRLSVGAAVVAIGLLAFGSAARRERMLFSSVAVRSRRARLSGWVASLVIGAFVFAYVYTSTGV